jgi:ABC-type multidrug transport system fused ATPase/permease subunit
MPWTGGGTLGVINFAVLSAAIIAVVGSVSGYLSTSLTANVGQWVMHDLRRTLYQHIHRLSLAEHDEKSTGDLAGRVTSDIESVQEFVTFALLGIVANGLTLVGIIAVMLYLDWRFTLISLAIAPVLFVVVYVFTRRIKTASREVRTKESALLSAVEEVFSSILLVKAFAREDYEERRFERHSLDNLEASLVARRLRMTLSPHCRTDRRHRDVRTSIVIAHHLAAIEQADVIFVVKDSRLTERGTHQELLAAGGCYAELHAIQSGGGASADVSRSNVASPRQDASSAFQRV